MPRISIIRTARAKLGYTQKDLGDLMNKSANSIRAWEAGIHIPKVTDIIKLQNILDIPLDDLMNEFKEEEK